MAITHKIKQTINTSGTKIFLTDDTGVYDSSDNTGGYGTENGYERSDLKLFMVPYYRGYNDDKFLTEISKVQDGDYTVDPIVPDKWEVPYHKDGWMKYHLISVDLTEYNNLTEEEKSDLEDYLFTLDGVTSNQYDDVSPTLSFVSNDSLECFLHAKGSIKRESLIQQKIQDPDNWNNEYLQKQIDLLEGFIAGSIYQWQSGKSQGIEAAKYKGQEIVETQNEFFDI